MIENKKRQELIREAERAFWESYAEDMDTWSALREEQEKWCGPEGGLRGEAAKLERLEF